MVYPLTQGPILIIFQLRISVVLPLIVTVILLISFHGPEDYSGILVFLGRIISREPNLMTNAIPSSHLHVSRNWVLF